MLGGDQSRVGPGDRQGSPKRYAYARFDEDQPLQIIDADDPERIYESFVCRVTSVPRTRAKSRRPSTIRSDLDDLLAALGERGPFETPSEYAAAFVRHSSESFRATVDRSGPRNLDSGLSEISIVFQAAVPKLVASKYTTSGVRRPSEL